MKVLVVRYSLPGHMYALVGAIEKDVAEITRNQENVN
jgi:hypothetical protein